MEEQLRQRLNRKLSAVNLPANSNKFVNSNSVDAGSVNLSGEVENTFIGKYINNEIVKDKDVNGENVDEYVDKYVDDKYVDGKYFYLQDEPSFSIIENIMNDPAKLTLILLFGVSIYALYALSKK